MGRLLEFGVLPGSVLPWASGNVFVPKKDNAMAGRKTDFLDIRPERSVLSSGTGAEIKDINGFTDCNRYIIIYKAPSSVEEYSRYV